MLDPLEFVGDRVGAGRKLTPPVIGGLITDRTIAWSKELTSELSVFGRYVSRQSQVHTRGRRHVTMLWEVGREYRAGNGLASSAGLRDAAKLMLRNDFANIIKPSRSCLRI